MHRVHVKGILFFWSDFISCKISSRIFSSSFLILISSLLKVRCVLMTDIFISLKLSIPDAIFIVGFRVKSCLELWQSVVTLELPIVVRHQCEPPEPLPPGPGELGDDSGHQSIKYFEHLCWSCGLDRGTRVDRVPALGSDWEDTWCYYSTQPQIYWSYPAEPTIHRYFPTLMYLVTMLRQ